MNDAPYLLVENCTDSLFKPTVNIYINEKKGRKKKKKRRRRKKKKTKESKKKRRKRNL